MKSIWKFPLGDSTHPTLTMPVGAEILSVQVQHGKPQLWALVDPDAPKEVRSFYVYGTGWDVEQNTLRFIGTVQMQGGRSFSMCLRSNSQKERQRHEYQRDWRSAL